VRQSLSNACGAYFPTSHETHEVSLLVCSPALQSPQYDLSALLSYVT
jgi:hypothetical protein